MELVGEGHEEGQPAEEDEEVVACGNNLLIVQDQVVTHEAEERKHCHAVVGIALDDIVAGDGRRINMVLSERPDERLCVATQHNTQQDMMTTKG